MQEMAGDTEGGDITTVQDLDKWLKKGSNPRYKNALYFVTEDGAPMSFQAVVQTKNLVRNAIQNDNNDEGFKVVSAAVNYENPRLYCDFTAERIPCLHCGKNK